MASSPAPALNSQPIRVFFPAADLGQHRAAQDSQPLPWFGGVLTAAEKFADWTSVLIAGVCANGVYMWTGWSGGERYPSSAVLTFAGCLGFLFLLLLECHGGYRQCVSLLGIRETERIVRVTAETLMLGWLAVHFSLTRISWRLISVSVLLAPMFIVVQKWQSCRLVQALRDHGRGTRKAIILGAGAKGRRVYSALLRSPKLAIRPVAFVDEDTGKQGQEIYEYAYRRNKAIPVLARPFTPELLRELEASVVIVAVSTLKHGYFRELAAQVASVGADVYWVPEDCSRPGRWTEYSELDGTMLARVSSCQPNAMYAVSKRVIDLAIAIALLIVLAPLFGILALTVKLTSPGPVFFQQLRVGQDGRPFAMYKFRSMFVRSPEYARSPCSSHDPRITPTGRWLRRLSLDEIPQLLNVIWGEMSLVGPRPEMPFIVEQYSALQRQRLAAKPGLTGLWQISADRDGSIHENLEYDLYYVRHRNLWMDFAILLHTPFFCRNGV